MQRQLVEYRIYHRDTGERVREREGKYLTIKIVGIKIHRHDVQLTLTGVTSTVSHSIGTPAVWKIFCTAAEISGPIPSPGMSVILRTSDAKFLVVIAGELTWKSLRKIVYYQGRLLRLRNIKQLMNYWKNGMVRFDILKGLT